MSRDVPIRGTTIRLGQLLKLADVVGGGGEVKAFLARHASHVPSPGLEARPPLSTFRR